MLVDFYDIYDPARTKKDPRPKRKLIIATPAFILSLLSGLVIITGIWLLGLKEHSTLYHNALLSTGTLSFGFFLFLSIGLYQGIKLKDELGDITHKISFGKYRDFSFNLLELPDVAGEGLIGIIVCIIAVVVLSALLTFLLWLLGNVLVVFFLLLTAGLYRVFFRGLRYVFRHGVQCRGRLQRSIIYGLGYTGLYSCWIYGLIFVLHYVSLNT